MSSPDDFETFMRSYQNMVYSTAVRILGNETDAADVTQEVFLRAYERYREISRMHRVGGWLKTVATNLCLNHLSRYRSRWRFFSDMVSGEEDGQDYASTLPAPDVDAQKHQEADQRRLVEEALLKLPTAQRVPLVLYHFEDMSYEEISRQLGVSLAKVKTDIHRAREALKKKLQLGAAKELTDGLAEPGCADAI